MIRRLGMMLALLVSAGCVFGESEVERQRRQRQYQLDQQRRILHGGFHDSVHDGTMRGTPRFETETESTSGDATPEDLVPHNNSREPESRVLRARNSRYGSRR